MSRKPLCFVLMPFGNKPAGSSRIVDFDAPLPFGAGTQSRRFHERQVGRGLRATRSEGHRDVAADERNSRQ